MKPFFSSADGPETSVVDSAYAHLPAEERVAPHPAAPSPEPFLGRIAVYDSIAAAPRVEDVRTASADSFIEELAARTYSSARDSGGLLPYTVVREIVENLVHARFQEPVISVLDGGNTIRFSDQGPGIPDKEKALLPGYTTATREMKDLIRGVGSGLPLVREFLGHEGGSLVLEDNLGNGTVVTLKVLRPQVGEEAPLLANGSSAPAPPAALALVPRLSTRQKRVLSLVLEYGEAGPTLVSRELAVGLSTAYRDLAFLEEVGLIASDETGKRTTTDLGTSYLDSLFG